MQLRQLGRTGVSLSVLGVGGGRLGLTQADDAGAAAILSRAVALGINYVDTASSYGQGVSEERIGRWLRGHRDAVFLATKLDQRSHDGAEQELRGCLERLQTERIDLIQVHAVNDLESLDRLLAPDGAVAALEEARRAGSVRFIGITGHREPEVLQHALDRYPFDTVLMPVGCMDGTDFTEAMTGARQRGTGLLGMKVFGHGALSIGGRAALTYALEQGTTSVVVGMNTLGELEENAAAAANPEPLSATVRTRLMELATAARTPEQHWWRHERQPAALR